VIRIVAVGKLKARPFRDGVADYERRIRRFAQVQMLEVPDREPQSEGQSLLAAARGEPLVALDARGETWDSAAFARFLGQHASPCFLLGGPDGLSEEVLQSVALRLSLSSLTFPHELARLILTEQIYRGLTILRGHPYHR
jgi:23S rRNA (pseudouridine1915-N3)-methyltransferase